MRKYSTFFLSFLSQKVKGIGGRKSINKNSISCPNKLCHVLSYRIAKDGWPFRNEFINKPNFELPICSMVNFSSFILFIIFIAVASAASVTSLSSIILSTRTNNSINVNQKKLKRSSIEEQCY